MKIKSLAICIALAATAGALPAMADDHGYTPSKNGVIGGATGFAVGAGATGYYLHRQGTKATAQSGGLRIRKTGAGQMKDAAGRLNRHTDPDFNKKYLDTYGEEHARKIDEAKKEQALKNEAKRKELKAQKKLDRKLAKENPDAAKKLKQERRKGETFNAHQKHKKDMRTLERKVGAEKGGAKASIKHRDDALKAKNAADEQKAIKRNFSKAKKNGKIGSVAAKNAKNGKKAAKTAKTVAKTGKTARKLKTVGKVAAGGAAGMVAGAAMGEQIPDAFDAAAYSYKMARNPKDAPKMLYGTAKGGVAMAGRMADTVTDPGKMARNLGNSARGVGKSIANTGVYKSVAKTKTGRAIGSATTWTTGKVSQGYKSVARTKTGKTIGAAAKTVDKYTFKQANKGVKATTKAVSKGSKVVAKAAKKEAKKAKKTAKKVGKALKKAFRF